MCARVEYGEQGRTFSRNCIPRGLDIEGVTKAAAKSKTPPQKSFDDTLAASPVRACCWLLNVPEPILYSLPLDHSTRSLPILYSLPLEYSTRFEPAIKQWLQQKFLCQLLWSKRIDRRWRNKITNRSCTTFRWTTRR